MAVVKKGLLSLVALISFIGAFFTGSPSIHAATGQSDDQTIITEWEMLWEQPGQSLTIEEVSALSNTKGWFTVHSDGDYPSVPEGIDSAWIKIKIPEINQLRPSLVLRKLYAKKLSIFIEDKNIYNLNRSFSLNLIEIILPIEQSESDKIMLIYVQNNTSKLGLYEKVTIGEFSTLQKSFIKSDLLELVLGASLILISFFMIVSVVFINRSSQPGWYSLFLVMLSVGTMILTYSSFLDKIFPEYGSYFNVAFDISSSLLMPSFFYFFENVFGRGPYGLITKVKKIQLWFAVLYTIALFSSFYSELIYKLYYTHGFLFFGISIILGNLLLLISLIYEYKNKNKEAIILAAGVSIFVGVGLGEVFWYMFIDRMYTVQLWKISILFFLASLLIILVRRVMKDYNTALEYSKQIEIFNEELQRSEKIELISHLAASIAHEVRNPLQVTRGFLQLLGGRLSGLNEKQYMKLAIDELDRASEIITDFLTFAKPDMGKNIRLNALEELNQIVGILAPLATLKGGIIKIHSEEELYFLGTSSKFKQAIINIIKNSIEAFRDGGEIIIELMNDELKGKVLIKIKDNGEGIEKEDLKRLGEPYYTKKNKGTGLGLMVTFRIIEAMNGDIIFTSEKGIGTEVCIRLPAS